MKYALPTNNVELLLSELNKIRRGIHPSFKGDGIYNADALLLKLCKESPVKAEHIKNQLNSEVGTDFHPTRIVQIRNTIIKNLELHCGK